MNWEKILNDCGVAPATSKRWASSFETLVRPASFSLGFSEIDDFLAQILHESSMLERTTENLNYSTAARIIRVWPSRFATTNDATPYLKNPQALGNKVYGGRMGNTEPNDGWTYRGRGLIMVTGKANYSKLGPIIGLDLVNGPDQLAQPYAALKSAIAWWENNVPDGIMGDVVKITKRVNGGDIGLDHRAMLAQKAKISLAVKGAP